MFSSSPLCCRFSSRTTSSSAITTLTWVSWSHDSDSNAAETASRTSRLGRRRLRTRRISWISTRKSVNGIVKTHFYSSAASAFPASYPSAYPQSNRVGHRGHQGPS